MSPTGSRVALWAVMVLGAILLAGAGCSVSRWSDNSQKAAFFSRVRPASGDTARLLRNAHYYRLMGRPQLALKELEEAYARDPDNLKIVDGLARCYEQIGRFEQAQKLYREALSRHPDNDALHNNLCFSYYLSGRFNEAEACFKEALARNPRNRTARNNLGLLYCRLNKPEEARHLWQEAEGEAAAVRKLNLAMGALGMEVPANLAQSHRPEPQARPQATTTGQTHLARPIPSLASPGQERLEKRVEIAARPAAPPVAETPRPVAPVPGPPLVEGAAPTPVAPVPAASAAVEPAPPQIQAVASRPAPPGKPDNQVPPLKEAVTAPPAPAGAAAPGPAPQEVSQTVVAAAKKAVAPAPAPVAAKAPEPPSVVREKPLTVEELVETDIEVRNGNGVRFMARHTRSRLSLEGFTVKRIGNYRDFGQKTTMVYYRPQAERVARSLYHTFFPTGKMQQTRRLRKGVDVKVVLGHDLLKRYDLMAMLSGGGII